MSIRALLSAAVFGVLAAQGIALAQTQRAPSASPTAPAPRPTLSEMRGTAADLAITTRGDVYVLDPSGGLWLQALDNRSGSWTSRRGEYSGVRATLDGGVWGLGIDGTLYRLVGTVWRAVAQDIRDVTATPDGNVLVLTSAGVLQTFARESQVIELAPQFANPTRVLSDQHGLLWLVYGDGRLARHDGLNLREIQSPPAGVANLSVDTEGNVMAVSRAGNAYQRNPQTAQWEETFPGTAFSAVAIGPGGKPWFIGADGKVLASQVFSQTGAPQTRPASAFTRMLTWKKTPGRSRELSIAEDGTVLRLDMEGGLWRWNRKDDWVSMQGRFVKVAALRSGAAWAIDAQGRLFRSQANSWLDMRTLAIGIAAGPGGILWMVQPDGRLARWDAKTSQWQPLRDASPPATSVAVGRDGEPWIIDPDGGVKSFQKGAWIDYPGIVAASLAVGPEGTVYATTPELQLLWLDSRERQWKPATGKARKVAVGPKGAPWRIDERDETYVSSLFASDDSRENTSRPGTGTSGSGPSATGPPGTGASGTGGVVFGSPPPGGSAFVSPAAGASTGVTITASLQPAAKRAALVYQTLNGTFQDVAISPAGTVFATGLDGGFYCFSNPDKKFVFATAGQARRVAVTPGGIPWVVSASGEIARFEAGAWRVVPNHRSQDVSVGSAGVVVSVGTDSQVYRFVPAQNLFEPITSFTLGTQLQAIRAARDDATYAIWAVTPSNQLLKCERATCESQSIGALDVSLAPDNAVYVLDKLGTVQRYNASRRAFEAQNGQGVSLAAGPQGVPWLVASGGRVNAAGFFAVSNTLINPANCAAPFLQQVQAPAPPPVAAGASISAAADSATLEPGGTLSLLANDRLNGAVPTTTQVSISFTADSTGFLTQIDGLLRVSATATRGSTLAASYTICTLTGSSATSVCASAAVTIAVAKGILPGAPTIGTATAGNASATVAFTAPAANGGSAITSYSVTSSPGGLTATSTGSPITVTGLTNGTAYTFTVVAINSAGTGSASATSNSVTPTTGTTVPGAPTIGTATPGNASATVAFTAPASNGGSAITSYRATSSPGGLTATSTGSPITVTGLTNGTAYTFTVVAINAIGTGAASAASNSVTPTAAPTAPGAPTIGTATAGNASATVAFTAPASNGGSAITSYRATASPGGLTATSTGSPITVTGLTNGTAYTFTVVAINAIGTSAASGASNSVTPVGAPGAPTIGTAVPSNSSASVPFTPPASNGGSPITSYTATSSPGGITSTSPGSPIIVTGLTNGTAYTFTVTATNAIGTGPASAALNSVTPVGAPGAPSINAAFPGDGVAFLDFNSASNGGSAITTYTATSSPPGGTGSGTPADASDAVPQGGGILVTGLTNGVSYTFTLTATNAVGTGPASAPSNPVTPLAMPGMPTITGVTALNATDFQINFLPPAVGAPFTYFTVTAFDTVLMIPPFMTTGASSPIVITVTNTANTHTIDVSATNTSGTGPSATCTTGVNCP